jgi:hypothetical protein
MTMTWINHDIHRAAPRPLPPQRPQRKLKPYPTRDRLLGLFMLQNDTLIRIVPHGNERADRIAGWINPKCGKRYIRVDDKQCLAERLIAIFNGGE